MITFSSDKKPRAMASYISDLLERLLDVLIKDSHLCFLYLYHVFVSICALGATSQ